MKKLVFIFAIATIISGLGCQEHWSPYSKMEPRAVLEKGNSQVDYFIKITGLEKYHYHSISFKIEGYTETTPENPKEVLVYERYHEDTIFVDNWTYSIGFMKDTTIILRMKVVDFDSFKIEGEERDLIKI